MSGKAQQEYNANRLTWLILSSANANIEFETTIESIKLTDGTKDGSQGDEEDKESCYYLDYNYGLMSVQTLG